jgi:hypothetical protein
VVIWYIFPVLYQEKSGNPDFNQCVSDEKAGSLKNGVIVQFGE